MRAFLDTSVLVPVFYGDHMHHAASLDLFTKFPQKDVCCGAHSLLEVYATLTRMPGKYRVSSEHGMLFIANIRERMTIVSLNAGEYGDMLKKFTSIGIVGGAIYDAFLAACALKAKAETLFTWNIRHYGQFGPEVARILQSPL
jgi:predicted nucleic acid-binding protein